MVFVNGPLVSGFPVSRELREPCSLLGDIGAVCGGRFLFSPLSLFSKVNVFVFCVTSWRQHGEIFS